MLDGHTVHDFRIIYILHKVLEVSYVGFTLHKLASTPELGACTQKNLFKPHTTHASFTLAFAACSIKMGEILYIMLTILIYFSYN